VTEDARNHKPLIHYLSSRNTLCGQNRPTAKGGEQNGNEEILSSSALPTAREI